MCRRTSRGRDRRGAAETASRQAALPAATVLRSRGGARETVETSRASEAAKLCLRFVILTAARSGEARGATWTETDPEAREWRTPGERMKGGVAHRVPLSHAALAILERGRALDDGSGVVFPSGSERSIHCQACHLQSCYGTAGWPTARRSTGSGRRSATGAPTRGPARGC